MRSFAMTNFLCFEVIHHELRMRLDTSLWVIRIEGSSGILGVNHAFEFTSVFGSYFEMIATWVLFYDVHFSASSKTPSGIVRKAGARIYEFSLGKKHRRLTLR
jgi:hypothetical protein